MHINVTPTVDLLGPGYTREDIVVGDQWNSRMVATLVRHKVPDAQAAVLWIHGFSDYFFHTHVAEFFARQGIELFALDLRRYGRSLRPGLIPNFVTAVESYYTEINEAIRRIRNDYGHHRVVGMGHSTGGLVWSNYAHDHRGTGHLDGLILNSPWFHFDGNDALNQCVTVAVRAVNAVNPQVKIRYPRVGIHGLSMHQKYHGEWNYDLRFKPILSEPVRAGWILAMRRAHHKVQRGMAIDVPILIMHSARSKRFTQYHEEAKTVDVVLNVASMQRYGPQLGQNVQLRSIPNATHDVTLAPEPARTKAFTAITTWWSTHHQLSGCNQ